MIGPFSGKYEFLSNFYPAKTQYDGQTYPTSEHAYQAAKTLDPQERLEVMNTTTPGRAKRAGQAVTLRPNWDSIKLDVMMECLRSKFSDPILKVALIATGDEELVEVNTWRDKFFGVCGGVGQNHLGKLLMQLRGELRDTE